MAVIPTDEAAEAVVAACAIASEHGAAIAAERVDPLDFYCPRYRRLFAVALELVGVVREDERIARAAAAAGVPVADVEGLVQARPVAWDSAGTYAARVVEAARRRRIMAQAEALYRIAATADQVELAAIVGELAAAS